MKRHGLLVLFALIPLLAGCAAVEDEFRYRNGSLLSAQEVRSIFQGNTVTWATGDTLYWDVGGTFAGRGPYGGPASGSWSITEEGRLCTSNSVSVYVFNGCYRVYADHVTRYSKLVDTDGELNGTVINVVAGNPNDY